MRKVVVEVQCSRCDRKESVGYDASKETPFQERVFEAQLRPDPPVLFDDLCGPCQRSVKALLEQIGKKVKGMSPDRMTKEPVTEPKAETKPPADAKKADPPPPPATGPRNQSAPSASARGPRAS
jgi:hypothetical protein